MNSKLWQNEESYRALFDHNVDPVMTFDPTGRFLAANAATEKVTGLKEQELFGQSFLSFIDEPYRDHTIQEFKKVLAGMPHQYETTIRVPNGQQMHLQITVIPGFINERVHHIHCIAKDITLSKNHDRILRFMAYHDGLTGLGNQRMFTEDLKEYLSLNDEMTTCAIWMIDIDRFKFINDHLGHETGDLLLSLLSERIQYIIKDDGFVYRYGGDEFAILTTTLDEEALHNKAKLLMKEISKPITLNGFETVLTASVGISICPHHGESAKELIRAADHAMYHSKNYGRNTYNIYNSDIAGIASNSLEMESLLHQALENNEFELYYQPQIETSTHQLSGMEALIRWNSPKYGLVSPASFIPLAEETGLIVTIGEWVIEEACRQNAEWQAKGYRQVPISVNLSLRQFYQTDLVIKIRSILERYPLDPKYLVLEITESIAMQEDIASRVLEELRDLGVGIALDDFGTGYSSLRYLHQFPINHLKIDKAFIDTIETKEGLAIVKTILLLGKNLGIPVTAEGVETETQLQLLTDIGCHRIQGYYFSRPLPAREFCHLIKTSETLS